MIVQKGYRKLGEHKISQISVLTYIHTAMNKIFRSVSNFLKCELLWMKPNFQT